MKYLLTILLVAMSVSVSLPVRAEPAKVDAEVLAPQANKHAGTPPPQPAITKNTSIAEDNATLTAQDQAMLLCQARDIMGEGDVPGAEYKPGVDAYGRPVAPADGNAATAFSIPERIDIPLNIDVLTTVGVITAPTPNLATNMGTISILKGGEVLFNGKEMTSTVQSYCAAHAHDIQSDHIKAEPKAAQ